MDGRTEPRIETVDGRTEPRVETVDGRTEPRIETVDGRTEPRVETVDGRTEPRMETVDGKTEPRMERVDGKTESRIETVDGRTEPRIETVGEEEVAQMISRGCKNFTNMVYAHPGRVLLLESYRKFAKEHHNFKFRTDDVVVMSFPKSGTTWLAETVWVMTHMDELHLLDQLGVYDRAHFIDKDIVLPADPEDQTSVAIRRYRELFPDNSVDDGVYLKLAASEESPRVLMTHIPLQLNNPDILETCKVIYVVRNPKDVSLSFYNFTTKVTRGETRDFVGEFAEFLDVLMSDQVLYSPYWEHIRQAWRMRHHPNLHFVFFENMKADGLEEVRKLNDFLKLDLTDDQLRKTLEVTSFDKMKSRGDKLPVFKEIRGKFFVKGQTGSFKGVASPDLDARMDAWIQENMKEMDIKFRYN